MDLFRRTKLSIIYKIMLSFVFFLFVIVTIMSVTIFVVEKNNIERITRDYSLEILDNRIDALSYWLDENKVFLQTAAASANLTSMSSDQYIPYMKKLLGPKAESLGNIFIFDIDGNYWDTQDNKRNIQEIKSDENFQSIINGTSDFVISNAIMQATFKQPSIIIGVPILLNGEVQGMLGATLFLKDLSSVLGQSSINGSGYAFIVDNNGNVVYHPNTAYILSMNVLTSYDQGFIGLGTIGNAMMTQQTGTGSFTDEQAVDRFAVFKPIPNTQWSMAIASYKSKVFESISSLITSVIIISVLALMLGILLSRYIALGITVPIKNLTQTVGEFAKGNHGARAKVESGDEIGVLADAYNKMAAIIVEHTENLEGLIQDRTQVLTDLNYQILTRNKELGHMNERLEETNVKLHQLATTDMLTGLYNRAEFVQVLDAVVTSAKRGEGQSFSLLFIDLDNFKYYNDTFSHEIGDFLLQEVSAIFRASTRDDDMVARYGGDEFVVLLRPGNYDLAKKIAERIHARIVDQDGYIKDINNRLNRRIDIPQRSKLSCSIGIVNFSKELNIQNVDELLKLADETMYIAKKEGKSRIVIH